MEQQLKCPRCDSLDTKFCYYNNYRRSQPRYLCRACGRKWTQGGALRDVPVGGGSRSRKPRRSKSSASSSASTAAPPPLQPLLQKEVVQNQLVTPSLNGGEANVVAGYSDMALQNQWLCSLPIAYTYHQGSGGGPAACYLPADLAGVQSLNASSQVPFNHSLNDGGVNVVCSIPTTNFSSSSTFAQPQSLVQNQLVSPSLPIISTYNQSSAASGAQARYLSSLTRVQSSQTFNQSLNSVLGSSDLALLSSFNGVGGSHASSQGRIESLYQSSIHPSMANSGVTAASHRPDQWPQSFINSDNNFASDDISWSDMFRITSNIVGDSDLNFSMPNLGPGLPGYGSPPQ